jgi:hypothetical protein
MADDARREQIRRRRTRSQIDKSACDRLFSELVRARGACQRCGTTSEHAQLQCAHIVSRRYTATRCDFANAWCLCAACHRRLTEHPDEHVLFAHLTRGADGYDAIRRRALDGIGTGRIDWTELRAALTAARKKIADAPD